MNFDRMRALLLERAIRGELVPQLTEDGSIEQVGNGRGLFDIPKSWGWFEFSKVVKTLSSRGNQIPAKEICERGRFPVVTQSKNSLIDGYSEEESKLVPKAFLPLLVFGDHTRFLKYVDFQFIVGADGTKLIRPKDDGFVNCSYLYYVLRALVPETKDRGYSRHFQFLKKLMIPVPPIHEQCRIVDRVEELLSEINRAEKAYEELQTLAGVLRGQILQEAIQGKLVPQLAEEGVVKQIGATQDEVPFKIPESWKWVKLKSVFSMQAGKFISASSIQPEGRFPCYGGNGLRGYVDISNRKGRFPLIGRQGALCGNVHVVDGEFYATEHAVVVDCGEYGDPDCVGLFLEAMNLNQYATATAQPGLSVKKIIELPFPLPPKDEQARIVSRVKDLMKQVDALSAR